MRDAAPRVWLYAASELIAQRPVALPRWDGVCRGAHSHSLLAARLAGWVALFLIGGTTAAYDLGPRPWETPAVSMINVEPPHATMAPFSSVSQALELSREQSPYRLSLNGPWRFHWSPVPEQAPARFNLAAFDDSRWDTIDVPSNWEMEGFGYPLFRNVHQPFPARPPLPPSYDNPVGCYRRRFVLPADWAGRRIVLHLAAVKSAFTLWVNGREVGYNEGGFEPAELDVTEHVRAGENLVAVRVLRYSDGTYLECQDMWRLAGIFRDVFLVAMPRVHVADFGVVTDLDPEYRDATLSVDVEVRNASEQPAQGRAVRVSLFDHQQRLVPGFPILSNEIDLVAGSKHSLRVERVVSAPSQWTAETPTLYTLAIELLDGAGGVTEVVSSRVGFREVEVRGQAILVNGVAVKLNGVNSHILDPLRGSAVDRETLRRDLVLMKQFNVNLVRTSHYPPPVEYLDLADELGLYVVDEVGDEAHATEYLSEDPAWRDAYVQRARKLVHRDRNHPSVIMWSAGNESGSGENVAAVIREGKRIDPSRPAWCYGGNTDLLPFEDVVGPRYPTPEDLERVAAVPAADDPRPSFLDEYLAATGNGMGGLDEYWSLIWRHPRLTGGAIWDWMSPGLTRRWRSTPDRGPHQVEAALMAGARLVAGRLGNAVALSGFDEWVEVYRHPALDLAGDELTLDVWVYPREWNGDGSFLTKGSRQAGLVQRDRETLELYIETSEGRVVASAPVPPDWERRWHHLAGIYDGREAVLLADGAIVARAPCRGPLLRTTDPINLGRTADIHGQEHPGQISNAVIDRARVFARALSPAELVADDAALAADAVLWLDLDEVQDGREYFSLGIGARDYGLVWPDRRVQAELWQLKKSPQPVAIEALDAGHGVLRITNRHAFTNLAAFDSVWELWGEGRRLASGALALDVPPGASREVQVPIETEQGGEGEERRLLVSVRLARDTAWAPAGHEVAWEQIELPLGEGTGSATASPAGDVLVREDDQTIVVSGRRFVYRFDRAGGRLVSMRVEGEELLDAGPRINLWRAPVWNETEADWGGRPLAEQWRAAGLDRLEHRVVEVKVSQAPPDRARIEVTSEVGAPGASARFKGRAVHTFWADGSLDVEQSLDPLTAMPEWLPKIGLQMKVAGRLRQLSWYGRGPFETYPDRKTGAKIGVYSGMVDDQVEPHLVPQDYGNKTDVRWAALTDGRCGLVVAGDALLSVSAQIHDTEHLTRALYPPQLHRDEAVTLNLDHRVTGVGETPNKTLPRYRVTAEPVRFTVRMRPLYEGERAAEVARELRRRR